MNSSRRLPPPLIRRESLSGALWQSNTHQGILIGKTIGRTINELQIPVYIERFGSSKDEIFVTASMLRKELGDKEFEELPTGALGLYTYYERLAQGLCQLMAGSRKFALEHMARDDRSPKLPCKDLSAVIIQHADQVKTIPNGQHYSLLKQLLRMPGQLNFNFPMH